MLIFGMDVENRCVLENKREKNLHLNIRLAPGVQKKNWNDEHLLRTENKIHK